MIGELERLGPANLAASANAGAVRDGTVYVGSRVLGPAVVGAFDLASREVRTNHRIEGSGGGALSVWGVEPVDDDLYVGLCGDGTLHRIDTASGAVETVADLPGCSFVWDLAADGDTVYAATYPDAAVFAYDAASGDVRAFGPAVDGEDYARSVAVADDAVYVGVGTQRAALVELDPETGERRDVLPADLAAPTTVSTVEAADGVLAAAVGSSLLVADPTDPANATVVEAEAAVGRLAVADGAVYYSDDALRRYDAAAGRAEHLADATAREVLLADGTVVGVGEELWTYSLADGSLVRTDLEGAGLARAAQRGQSLGFFDAPFAGGSGQLTRFAADGRTRVRCGGEPKTTAVAGGRLYLCLYTGARIARCDPETGDVEEVATVGHEQNRPRDCHYHEATGLLFVGTRPDYGMLGGALVAFDPASEECVAVSRDLVPDQAVAAVGATPDDLVVGSEIHGGGGADPVASEARLVGVDPGTLAERWSAVPVPGVPGITGVAGEPSTGEVCGLTETGTFFVFDPAAGETVHEEDVANGSGQLLVHDGRVYGLTFDVLFRYDPDEGVCRTLVDGLAGDWHSTPTPAAGDGALYALSGRDLVRVSLGGGD